MQQIPPGVRTTLSVLAQISAELSASRTNAGQGSSEHAKPAQAPDHGAPARRSQSARARARATATDQT